MIVIKRCSFGLSHKVVPFHQMCVFIPCVTDSLSGTLNPKPSQKPSGMKEHIEQD